MQSSNIGRLAMVEQSINLRPSFLTTYADCSLKAMVHYYPQVFTSLGYTLNRSVPHLAAAVGTGVHASVADSMTQKMGGAVVNLKDATEVGVMRFREMIANGFAKDVLTPNPDTGEKQIEKMNRAFMGVLGYKLHTQFVEKTMSVPWASGYNLTGTPDLFTANGHLPDLKTGRVSGPHLYQSGGYITLLEKSGYQPKTAGIIFVKRMPADKDQERPVEVPYNLQIAKRVAAAQIDRVIRDIELFKQTQDTTSFQMNPNSKFCTQKSCRAYNTNICPMWTQSTADKE